MLINSVMVRLKSIADFMSHYSGKNATKRKKYKKISILRLHKDLKVAICVVEVTSLMT